MLRATSGAMHWSAAAPLSANSPGAPGDFYFDAANGWAYFCTALNTWLRYAISSW